jgi:hypothetical protein
MGKSPATNRFSGWIEREVLKCRDSGLQIPDEPLQKILVSAIGLKQYSRDLYDRATKAEQNEYADRWSFRDWTYDFDGDFNPVYIDKLRKHLANNISDMEWLQRHFSALKDAPQHIAKHWYAFGSGAHKSVISIDFARYLSILKFSLFIRKYLGKLYSWTTKAQSNRINEIFDPKSLVDEVVSAWHDISIEENIARGRGRKFNTIFAKAWARIQFQLESVEIKLPNAKSLFSNSPEMHRTYLALLGQQSEITIADGTGLKGGLEVLLHRWTSSNGRQEILPMDPKNEYQSAKLRYLDNATWITPNFTYTQIQDLDLDWT